MRPFLYCIMSGHNSEVLLYSFLHVHKPKNNYNISLHEVFYTYSVAYYLKSVSMKSYLTYYSPTYSRWDLMSFLSVFKIERSDDYATVRVILTLKSHVANEINSNAWMRFHKVVL